MEQYDKRDRAFRIFVLDDFGIQKAIKHNPTALLDSVVYEVLGPTVDVAEIGGIPWLRVATRIPFDFDSFGISWPRHQTYQTHDDGHRLALQRWNDQWASQWSELHLARASGCSRIN
jgi:hypothetical protein